MKSVKGLLKSGVESVGIFSPRFAL
jgi:hypothetical protein